MLSELTEGFEMGSAARETFWRRLELLHRALVVEKSSLWRGACSVVVEMGPQSEDAAKFNRTSALYFHLFGYEVLNSVVLLREGELHVLARAEKSAELNRLLGSTNPNAKEGDPPLCLKVHSWESSASVKPLVAAAAAAGPTLGVLRSALPDKEDYQQQQQNGSSSSSKHSSSSSSSGGSLLRAWDAAIRKEGFILVDVSRAAGSALAKKDDEAIVRTAAAGKVACRALCDGVTRLVEAAFDADRDERATHDALAQQIDALMCDALAPHCARAIPKMKDCDESVAKRCASTASVACANAQATRSTRLVESCYFPIVTSGGACTTDAGAASDTDAINDDVVVVEFGARFASYCTNVARTFFVEPLPSLEKCYAALRGVHAACVSSMRDGTPLSGVSTAAHEWLENNDAGNLVKYLPRHNFGFALGLDFRDDELVLTKNNSRHFEARMIFNVAIGLHGVPLDAGERRKARGAIRDLKKVSLLLADTVLVQSGGAPPVVLTDFSATRPALKDWRDVSNLATSQRERAATLAAQRAAAAEAELLAQLDAEAAASTKKTNSVAAKKAGGKGKKKKGTNSTESTTVSQPSTTPAAAPLPSGGGGGSEKQRRGRSADDVADSENGIEESSTPEPTSDDDRVSQTEEATTGHASSSADRGFPAASAAATDSSEQQLEAEAAQLLERVRAAGRSRWCESCESAIKDAREFLDASSEKKAAVLERAVRELAESLPAWRGIELALERSKHCDQLRAALNKASAAGFPAKATAVKRAKRRLKEMESAGPSNASSTETTTAETISSTLRAKADDAFVVVAGKAAPREPKPSTPKVVDELSKYFHGDEHEISQLREQKIDLTKLVILAGRGAPRLAPWRDSQPPSHAVAVGRVLGLLGRLAPRVFVNLSAAERTGLLLRGGSPPREWLALSNPPPPENEAAESATPSAAPPPPPPVEVVSQSPPPKTSAEPMKLPVVAPFAAGPKKVSQPPPRGWGPVAATAPAAASSAMMASMNAKQQPAPVAKNALNKTTSPFPGPPGVVLGPPPGVGDRHRSSPSSRSVDAPTSLSSRRAFSVEDGTEQQKSALRNPFVGASLDWSRAAPRPSSSWDATPDGFGSMRDEISAMADAAYFAAIGGGAPPPRPVQPVTTTSVRRIDRVHPAASGGAFSNSAVLSSNALGSGFGGSSSSAAAAAVAEVLLGRILPLVVGKAISGKLACLSRSWARAVSSLRRNSGLHSRCQACGIFTDDTNRGCSDCADESSSSPAAAATTCLSCESKSGTLRRRLVPCDRRCGRMVCDRHAFKCDGVNCGCGRTFCRQCEPPHSANACAGPLCGRCCRDCFYKEPDGPAHGFCGLDHLNRPLYKCAACRNTGKGGRHNGLFKSPSDSLLPPGVLSSPPPPPRPFLPRSYASANNNNNSNSNNNLSPFTFGVAGVDNQLLDTTPIVLDSVNTRRIFSTSVD